MRHTVVAPLTRFSTWLASISAPRSARSRSFSSPSQDTERKISPPHQRHQSCGKTVDAGTTVIVISRLRGLVGNTKLLG